MNQFSCIAVLWILLLLENVLVSGVQDGKKIKKGTKSGHSDDKRKIGSFKMEDSALKGDHGIKKHHKNHKKSHHHKKRHHHGKKMNQTKSYGKRDGNIGDKSTKMTGTKKGQIKNGYSLKDIKCSKHGDTLKKCESICIDENMCQVNTFIKRCTCKGVKIGLEDNSYFNSTTGEKVTSSGLDSIDDICDSCYGRCQRWLKKGKKQSQATNSTDWDKLVHTCDDSIDDKDISNRGGIFKSKFKQGTDYYKSKNVNKIRIERSAEDFDDRKKSIEVNVIINKDIGNSTKNKESNMDYPSSSMEDSIETSDIKELEEYTKSNEINSYESQYENESNEEMSQEVEKSNSKNQSNGDHDEESNLSKEYQDEKDSDGEEPNSDELNNEKDQNGEETSSVELDDQKDPDEEEPSFDELSDEEDPNGEERPSNEFNDEKYYGEEEQSSDELNDEKYPDEEEPPSNELNDEKVHDKEKHPSNDLNNGKYSGEDEDSSDELNDEKEYDGEETPSDEFKDEKNTDREKRPSNGNGNETISDVEKPSSKNFNDEKDHPVQLSSSGNVVKSNQNSISTDEDSLEEPNPSIEFDNKSGYEVDSYNDSTQGNFSRKKYKVNEDQKLDSLENLSINDVSVEKEESITESSISNQTTENNSFEENDSRSEDLIASSESTLLVHKDEQSDSYENTDVRDIPQEDIKVQSSSIEDENLIKESFEGVEDATNLSNEIDTVEESQDSLDSSTIDDNGPKDDEKNKVTSSENNSTVKRSNHTLHESKIKVIRTEPMEDNIQSDFKEVISNAKSKLSSNADKKVENEDIMDLGGRDDNSVATLPSDVTPEVYTDVDNEVNLEKQENPISSNTTSNPNVTEDTSENRSKEDDSGYLTKNEDLNLIKSGNGHFEDDIKKKLKWSPPNLTRQQCSPRGNETRTCIEECNIDGLTCTTAISLQRCTCSGRYVNLVELRKYDLTYRKIVSYLRPLSEQFGDGYINECGNCFKFCDQWPGEKREYIVTTKALSCYDPY